MNETKTAGQVARDAFYADMPDCHEQDEIVPQWHRAAAAVIAWQEAQQWRPMVEAPRDGQFVLIEYKAGHYSVSQWDDGLWWTKGGDRYADESNCLRWRSLPVAPEVKL